jgi:2-methylisocitrate lyase-like PEP mutase family enzyme
MTSTAHDASALLHSLHHAPHRPLLLANAWDAASARLIEEAGSAAIATTSAGIAWALGQPDGGALSRVDGIAAIRRITAAVTVPVTADIEGGYADDVEGVAETIAAVIDAGAAGINIEDGSLSPQEFAERIAAARNAADRAGVPLFINARTDVYLAGLVAPGALLEETIARAERYLAAGADGVFVPGVSDIDSIRSLVDAIDAPLNVMVGPGSPTVAQLAEAGVARVSLGSAVAQSAYAVAQRAAAELLSTGTYDATADALDYGQLNSLLSGH